MRAAWYAPNAQGAAQKTQKNAKNAQMLRKKRKHAQILRGDAQKVRKTHKESR